MRVRSLKRFQFGTIPCHSAALASNQDQCLRGCNHSKVARVLAAETIMNWFLMWFLFAFGQSQATPKPLAPPPPLETGSFQNGIYRNDQLGLIYRLPIRVRQIHSLAPDEKLVRKGKLPPQGYLSLSTYQSNSESLPSSSGLNTGAGYEGSVIRIMAYYDQYYANSEDAIAYLRKLEKNAKGAADKVLRDSEECTFNGHKFYRSDFLRLSNPAIYSREP